MAANPQDKWLLVVGNRILVVTKDGSVFAHDIAGNSIGVPFQLGGPKVAANPQDKWVLVVGNRILVVTKQQPWRYYTGVKANGRPDWKEEEALAQPLPPFGSLGDGTGYHECLGYFSVRFIDGWRKWVMLYTCANDESAGYNKNNGPRGIYLRTSDVPWGPWSPPQHIFDPKDGYCYFMYYQLTNEHDDYCKNKGGSDPAEQSVRDTTSAVTNRGWGGEYAPLLLPSRYAKVGANQTTLYFLMSTWNPYQVVLMRTQVTPNP